MAMKCQCFGLSRVRHRKIRDPDCVVISPNVHRIIRGSASSPRGLEYVLRATARRVSRDSWHDWIELQWACRRFGRPRDHDFKQVAVNFSTWVAFQVLVLEFDTGNESDKLLFNEENLRQSAHFRELRSNDVALDQLSTRRCVTTFDRIKAPE
jgi:hypothetical protein